ncbi:MAG: 4-phosphopantetheinyl transferase family protein [Starkeya sp.]|nr:4-phosphopantetheinyl transferase family protein [Starkeya sp.]
MSAPPAPGSFRRAAPFALEVDGRRFDGAMALVAAPLAELEAAAPDDLAPDEAALLTERLAPARRQSLLAGRRAAKDALSLLAPELDRRDIRVLPGLFGQPVVTMPGRANVQVTLAHAGAAALALAHPEACPMGVDLECFVPAHLGALREQTTAREREAVRVAMPDDEGQQLLLLWSLKEALSKALRTGLTVPFALLEVSHLSPVPGGLTAQFANFAQYEGIAFAADPLVAAVVRPRLALWREGEGSASPFRLQEWLGALATLG